MNLLAANVDIAVAARKLALVLTEKKGRLQHGVTSGK